MNHSSLHPQVSDGENADNKSFFQSGHLPTLVAAFLYFDVSFMVWILLGPLAPAIMQHMHLTATQKGLMVAIPLLGGACFRPFMGALCDRIGGRKTGLIGLSLTLLPLLWGWKFASAPWHFYALGFLLGIAGASFAVALPLASKWYPKKYQGLVMGIAGAGNSGTLITTLFAPRLAQHFGWSTTFALAALPIMLVLILFSLLAKDSPKQTKPITGKDYRKLLGERDTRWLCFFYSLTFGGFVGLASFLTLFFHDQYHLTAVQAGDVTTLVVFAGSYLRPVGGWLSDKFGGYRMLLGIFTALSLALFGVAQLPALNIGIALLFLAMALLGMGNGAVFQLVPLRFPGNVGVVTGIVGAAGGFGGFVLPDVMGVCKDHIGSYGDGFLIYAGVFIITVPLLLELAQGWRNQWPSEVAERAGLLAHRQRLQIQQEFIDQSEAVVE